MFFFFKKSKKGTGALIDTRSEEEKQKDYLFEEIVSEPEPVNWVEKPQSQWRKFPIYDQNSSNACVAFSLAKILGIMHQVNEREWIDFSPGFIYQQRANKPQAGMGGVDAWEIVRKNGALLESFFPSQGKNDDYLDSYQVKNYEKQIAAVFRISNYVILPTKDINVIASTIQKTGKSVMVWYYWTYDEWDRSFPIIKNPALDISQADKHSVVAVDYTLYNGKKCLVIEDSWGKNRGINGQRIISEDFHSQRNFFAAYPINFQFEEATIQKPFYVFNKDLYYGMQDYDVKMLQCCLKYEGLFPLNSDCTGYFGGLTLSAVKNFQAKYGLPQTGYVGEMTREKLNQLFGS
uniref:Peptidase C1A papain n=1 Tax=Dictyoglomus turgidum TaxID=513050 RepID=A0A7C3SQ48_9BACT